MGVLTDRNVKCVHTVYTFYPKELTYNIISRFKLELQVKVHYNKTLKQ